MHVSSANSPFTYVCTSVNVRSRRSRFHTACLMYACSSNEYCIRYTHVVLDGIYVAAYEYCIHYARKLC
jgi:hypothetical protein